MKPNVLLIHADQHRFDCLGAYGNKEIQTPNIDALARDGAVYHNSFCPYPVCTPSRYSLLSGLHVHEHGGSNNHCTPRQHVEFFPQVMREHGYRTKAVGKMHFTPTYLDVGFDQMELCEQDGPGRWDDDYHRELKDLGLVDAVDIIDQRSEYRKNASKEYWENFGAVQSDLPEKHHSTKWIGDRAATTLDTWNGDGNLLMVGFVKPHHPFDPPETWCDKYKDLSLLPGWIEQCFDHDLACNPGYFPHEKLSKKTLQRVMAYYYATISQIDAEVGRMIEILKRKGHYENTMIVYTSDHGDYMGYHHLLLKGNYMYEPLARVPLIIKYPDSCKRSAELSGTDCHDLVNNIDLAPTILGLTGCSIPEQMGGYDLSLGMTDRKTVFAEGPMRNSHTGIQLMARTATRKLILSDTDATSLLFDLERDPLEMANLISSPDYKDDVEGLKKAIVHWRGSLERVKPNIDENADQIEAPNVPPLDGSHRESMIEYFRRAVGKKQE